MITKDGLIIIPIDEDGYGAYHNKIVIGDIYDGFINIAKFYRVEVKLGYDDEAAIDLIAKSENEGIDNEATRKAFEILFDDGHLWRYTSKAIRSDEAKERSRKRRNSSTNIRSNQGLYITTRYQKGAKGKKISINDIYYLDAIKKEENDG